VASVAASFVQVFGRFPFIHLHTAITIWGSQQLTPVPTHHTELRLIIMPVCDSLLLNTARLHTYIITSHFSSQVSLHLNNYPA